MKSEIHRNEPATGGIVVLVQRKRREILDRLRAEEQDLAQLSAAMQPIYAAIRELRERYPIFLANGWRLRRWVRLPVPQPGSDRYDAYGLFRIQAIATPIEGCTKPYRVIWRCSGSLGDVRYFDQEDLEATLDWLAQRVAELSIGDRVNLEP